MVQGRRAAAPTKAAHAPSSTTLYPSNAPCGAQASVCAPTQPTLHWALPSQVVVFLSFCLCPQVKYVVELTKALALHPAVYRVELLTRLIR